MLNTENNNLPDKNEAIPKETENTNKKDLNDIAENTRQEIGELERDGTTEEKINGIQNVITEMEELHRAFFNREITDKEFRDALQKKYKDMIFEDHASRKAPEMLRELFANTLKKLEKTSKISEKIQSTKMSLTELEEFFGVDDLFGNYEKIKSALELIADAEFQKNKEIYAEITGGINVENDSIYIPQNAEHLIEHNAAKLWSISQRKMPSEAVKNYLAGVKMVIKGKMITCMLPPYMRYEDFEGGRTYRNPENNICEIIDIQQEGDDIIIEYMDQNKQKQKTTFVAKK